MIRIETHKVIPFVLFFYRHRGVPLPALLLAGGIARGADVRLWLGDRARRIGRDHRRWPDRPGRHSPAHEIPAYLEKYESGIEELKMTPEAFSREYSLAIRVTPAKVRGW